VQRGPNSGLTRDGQPAAERLNAVMETGEAGSPGGIGSTDSVVSNRQMHVVALDIDANVNRRSLGVFGRVRQGFGNAPQLPVANQCSSR